ncbi:MAG: HRDC domain-containing protein, partial [Candidatus Rifleibacteriota bacterium]
VFGLMKESTLKSIRSWIDQLIVQGFLLATEGQYPLLKVTQSGLELCKGNASVRLGLPIIKKVSRKKRRSTSSEALSDTDAQIFEQLRKLRLLIARKLSLPPYMVFADSTLISMAALKPEDIHSLRQIKGVGDQKRDRYGKQFLEVLKGGDPEAVADEFN